MSQLAPKFLLIPLAVLMIAGCVEDVPTVPTAAKGPCCSGLPQPIQAAIKASYRDATVVHNWRDNVEGQRVYEVTLRRDGKNFDVSFTADGQLVESETPLSGHELPAAVSAAVAARHPGLRLVKAEEARPAHGGPFYEVSLSDKGISVKSRYDQSGMLVSETRMENGNH